MQMEASSDGSGTEESGEGITRWVMGMGIGFK